MTKNSSLQLLLRLLRHWSYAPRRWQSETKLPKVFKYPKKQDQVFDDSPDFSDRGIATVDACNADLTLPEPRVVIVGAGMAGLAAASRLVHLGITDFTVLEATGRFGGRIFSSWIGDSVAELGCHWQANSSSKHPVYTMSAAENPPRPSEPAAESSRGLFNSFSSFKFPFAPLVDAYYKFRQIEREAASIYCLGGNKQHGSILNFMSMRLQQELHRYPREHQHDVARVMFGMCNQIFLRSPYDTANLCIDRDCTFLHFPGGDVRVPLGLIGMLAPLVRDIPPHKILYSKPVATILWGTCLKSGYRALVTTEHGEEYPADYVIITMPVGTLIYNSDKLFCPALPCSKIEALRRLGPGHCNKIYLEYSRPFWYWQTTNLNFRCSSGMRMDWTRGVTAIEVAPQSKCVLVIWVVGPEAKEMESLSDKDVAESLTSLLRELTKSFVPYPCSLLRSDWSTNRYFLGAYSTDESTDGSAQRALACPLPGPSEPVPPILLFAGEATAPGYTASIQGARISGFREAERIVALTNQFRGPPLPGKDKVKKRKAKKCKD